MSESGSRPARRGFWISVLANASGTVLAAAILAVYGQATGAIRENPRGMAAVAILVLAGTAGLAFVVLNFVVLPRAADPDQRRAIRLDALTTFLLLELAISAFGSIVYRWRGGTPA